MNEVIDSVGLPIGLLILKNSGDIIVEKVPAGAGRVIEKLRLCKKCGMALRSIVSPTGELIGYKCYEMRVGGESKVINNRSIHRHKFCRSVVGNA